jgi:hypothetical protein
MPLTILIPGKLLETPSTSSLWLRDSAMIINKRRERGHPCLRPLLHWKREASQPLIDGAIQGEL